MHRDRQFNHAEIWREVSARLRDLFANGSSHFGREFTQTVHREMTEEFGRRERGEDAIGHGRYQKLRRRRDLRRRKGEQSIARQSQFGDDIGGRCSNPPKRSGIVDFGT